MTSATAVLVRFPWKDEMSRLTPVLPTIIEACAEELHIDSRDIRKQLLLHLPRFSPQQLREEQTLRDEARRLGKKLSVLQADYSHWADRPRMGFLDRRRVETRACEGEIAQEIYRRFHYIGSCRDAIMHIGLFNLEFPDVPFAIAALSEMDIAQLSQRFPCNGIKSVLLLSRVFAFGWAPRNSISFLLGAVHAWVREHHPQVRDLITYVNPNLGFTGRSYFAANWRPFLESSTQYLYLNDDYISYRTFLNLEPERQSFVKRSFYELEPLHVLSYRLRSSHGCRA